MSQSEHGELPSELSCVADQLRSHRYEASALELDQAKERILKRAHGQRAARGGRMRKRNLATAAIMVGAIGTGSAAALAVTGGLPAIPGLSSSHHHASAANPSASIAQYGTRRTITLVFCRPVFVRAGRSTRCYATVVDETRPTGTVTFSSRSGTFDSSTCTLAPLTRSSSRCSVIYTPPTPVPTRRRPIRTVRHGISAHYSGDSTHAPSDGSTIVVASNLPGGRRIA